MFDPFRLQLYGLIILGLVASHGYVAFKSYSSGYKSANEENRLATERLNERLRATQDLLLNERELLRQERQERLEDALAADQGEVCKYDEAYRRRLNGLVQ